MLLELRPAMVGEEKILFELIRELALYEKKDPDSLPLTIEKLRAFGFSKEPYFFTEFAEVESEVIGYALYFYAFSASLGHPVLYLEDLYVKPEHRGKGIGTSFLKKLADYAVQRNCCRLEWHVFSWNESALKFYDKIGGNLRKDLIKVTLEL